MNQLEAMRIFAKIVDAGSFAAAARSLDLSKAVVTRQVAMLEAHLNTRLLNRTTRKLSLTEAGETYLEACRLLVEHLDDIEAQISNSAREPVGTLRIATSASFALAAGTPLFTEFRKRYPKVHLRVSLLDRMVDLVEEGFDVGIMTHGMYQSDSMIRRPLLGGEIAIVASPDYLEAHGTPQTPADLLERAFVALNGWSSSHTYVFENTSGETETLVLRPVYEVNNAMMVRDAAIAGIGFSTVVTSLAQSALESGALVRLLPDHAITNVPVGVSLVYPGRQHISAKTRAFIDFTVAYCREVFGVVQPG
ncbi:LysR family transcriptional regulator [Pararobbsia silviterrae]|uniref:LysR family transcriptional regulator n=1 Tax=Pararobbsia silviterrae TaxID=1792498 RepID=A0A494XVS1_9BURK|nr:LysR family transcriptional regulator [Pararobbsia silviterrae]RKP54668.1 LysR family transcriptional regulator [Pararobbsia silviterrae]